MKKAYYIITMNNGKCVYTYQDMFNMIANVDDVEFITITIFDYMMFGDERYSKAMIRLNDISIVELVNE